MGRLFLQSREAASTLMTKDTILPAWKAAKRFAHRSTPYSASEDIYTNAFISLPLIEATQIDPKDDSHKVSAWPTSLTR
jgi:hypothetical protein